MAFQLPPPPGVNEFRSASWQDWFYKLRAGLISAFNTITLQGIPPGGDTDQVLAKISNTDYDVDWVDAASGGLPAGGDEDDVLTKASGSDYDVIWASIPDPDLSIPPPGNNIVHNSYFQVRNKLDQEQVGIQTSAPYKQQTRRWYGIADADDFETQLVTTNDQNFITIKRYQNANTDPVRLVQILDTEDSLKWADKEKVMRVNFSLKTGANVSQVTFSVSSGEGVDESLDDYLTGSWTNQTEVVSATTNGAHTLLFDATITQIAFEISVEFDSTSSATDDEVYVYYFLVDDLSDGSNNRDSKSLAVVQRECNRYYQEMDLYLTTSYINIPIYMRDVPTVTIDGSPTFDTTGTTAEILIIKLSGGETPAVYTVRLNAELE